MYNRKSANNFEKLMKMSSSARRANLKEFLYIRVISEAAITPETYVGIVEEVSDFFGVKYRAAPKNWDYKEYPYLGILTNPDEGNLIYKLGGFKFKSLFSDDFDIDITLEELRHIRAYTDQTEHLIKTGIVLKSDLNKIIQKEAVDG